MIGEDAMAIRPVDLVELESKAANIYEAIIIMSKRARQINEELKIEFNKRIEMIQTKLFDQTEEPVEVEANPDQINIAREFERLPKPTETALEELRADRLEARYKGTEEK
jgi:DNA-directed RNA polymerase subunit K/omega